MSQMRSLFGLCYIWFCASGNKGVHNLILLITLNISCVFLNHMLSNKEQIRSLYFE